MTTHRAVAVLLIAVLLSSCSSERIVQDTAPAVSRSKTGVLLVKMQSNTYLIKQGDNVDLSVWGYPEFNTSTLVKSGGTITVPLLGEIKAVGLAKDDFSDLIRARLSEYVQGEPRITLSVSSPLSQKVTVLGAVTRQDNYPVTSDVSLVEILSTAGGTTPESDLNHVKILRYGNNGEPTEVDVSWHMETGNVDLIPKVRPGDTVFVPKKENFIRSFSDFLRDVVLLFGFFRVLN